LNHKWARSANPLKNSSATDRQSADKNWKLDKNWREKKILCNWTRSLKNWVNFAKIPQLKWSSESIRETLNSEKPSTREIKISRNYYHYIFFNQNSIKFFFIVRNFLKNDVFFSLICHWHCKIVYLELTCFFLRCLIFKIPCFSTPVFLQ
jgi:hypothetical protein